ncbi:hypothetical protein GBAR_LOCUS7107, partial [Geodia barretti]
MPKSVTLARRLPIRRTLLLLRSRCSTSWRWRWERACATSWPMSTCTWRGRGGGSAGRSRKLVRLSSISSMTEQDGHSSLGVRTRAQVLDDVGVPQAAQEVDLSLEALHDAVGGGVPGLEEDGVQDFGGADELVTLDPVHCSVRAVPQRVRLRLDQSDVAEAEATLHAYSCCAIIWS